MDERQMIGKTSRSRQTIFYTGIVFAGLCLPTPASTPTFTEQELVIELKEQWRRNNADHYGPNRQDQMQILPRQTPEGSMDNESIEERLHMQRAHYRTPQANIDNEFSRHCCA